MVLPPCCHGGDILVRHDSLKCRTTDDAGNIDTATDEVGLPYYCSKPEARMPSSALSS